MPGWLRFVLVWIVALALPLQGLASSGAARCAGEHHRAGESIAPPDQAAAERHAAQPSVHDQGHAQAQAQPHAGTSDAPPSTSEHSCSLCAACSPGLALLRLPPTVAAPEAARDHFAALPTALARIVTDAPERPPRG
jgi:hypothetical protein